jgi:hypothetical protein
VVVGVVTVVVVVVTVAVVAVTLCSVHSCTGRQRQVAVGRQARTFQRAADAVRCGLVGSIQSPGVCAWGILSARCRNSPCHEQP